MSGDASGLKCKTMVFEDNVAFSGGEVKLASGTTTTGTIVFPKLFTQHGTSSRDPKLVAYVKICKNNIPVDILTP